MSSSLNLSNNQVGYFNDIYLLKSTGQSSIYETFGTKTEMSNLGLATLNSTLISMQGDIDNNQLAILDISNNTSPSLVSFDYLTTSFWNNTLGTIDGKNISEQRDTKNQFI